MEDNEIKREKTFEEEAAHYEMRIKEVFAEYENPNGCEDPLQICVIRDSTRVVQKAQETINRLQAEVKNLSTENKNLTTDLTSAKAEIDKYEQIKTTLNQFWDNLLKIKIAKRKEKPTLEEFAEAIKQIEAEAYNEFAERLQENFELCRKEYKDVMNDEGACAMIIAKRVTTNLLKEMVGEDNEKEN